MSKSHAEIHTSALERTMIRTLAVLGLLVVAAQALSLSQLKGIKLKSVVNGKVEAVVSSSASELFKKSSFPFSKSDPCVIFAVRRPG